MNLCKDCKHFGFVPGQWYFGQVRGDCLREAVEKISPVDGSVSYEGDYGYCQQLRKPDGECGPKGKYFEEKVDD